MKKIYVDLKKEQKIINEGIKVKGYIFPEYLPVVKKGELYDVKFDRPADGLTQLLKYEQLSMSTKFNV